MIRCVAMAILGTGLIARDAQAAVPVLEATVAAFQQNFSQPSSENRQLMLTAEGQLARGYTAVGRTTEALRLRRANYAAYLNAGGGGPHHQLTLRAANNLAHSLVDNNLWAEARVFNRKQLSAARRALGDDHATTLALTRNLIGALINDPTSSNEDAHEAIALLERSIPSSQRVLGPHHPETLHSVGDLERIRSGTRTQL